MLENPITLVLPNGEDYGPFFSWTSFLEDKETITEGEASGAASTRTTTYSFLIQITLFLSILL